MDMMPRARTFGRWESLEELVERHEGFLIDLDGVVYVGDVAVPGAPDAIVALKQRGKRIVFITNDPRSSRLEYRARLATMGIAAEEDEIVTAGYATASYLVQVERARGSKVFVIGSPALHREISGAGLDLVDMHSESADFVVVGGHEGFHYGELRKAAQLIREGGRLIATGRDPTFPMPDGPWPATGSIVAAVEVASGRTALVIGKPEAPMFEAARNVLDDCRHVAVIGDGIGSDIEGGNRAGLTTVLVAQQALTDPPPGQRPDATVSGLADLVPTTR